MSLDLIALVALALLLLAALPTWRYSLGWGCGPSSGLGLVVVGQVLLLVTGKL